MTPDDSGIVFRIPPDDPEKLIRWGIGDVGEDSPSVWDLRAGLLSSVAYAEDLAHDLPRCAATVTRFKQDIRGILKELMSSQYGRLDPPSPFFKTMEGLSSVRALTSFVAERDPENREAFTRFAESLIHVEEEFFRIFKK